MIRICNYLFCANDSIADVYDYPVPFNFSWNNDQKYHASFLYMSMLVSSLESLLSAEDEANYQEVEVKAGGNLDRSSRTFPDNFSVFDLIRKRYIEDFALSDENYRESQFGSCQCLNSDSVSSEGIMHLKKLLPGIDLNAFTSSSDALAEVLRKVGNAIVPSRIEPRYVASVVVTKAADFVEDFFHWISHEVIRHCYAIGVRA